MAFEIQGRAIPIPIRRGEREIMKTDKHPFFKRLKAEKERGPWNQSAETYEHRYGEKKRSGETITISEKPLRILSNTDSSGIILLVRDWQMSQ